jgi:hypothetical protein
METVVHSEDLSSLMAKWSELRTSGKPGEIEARVRRHDGAYRWFLIRVEPFRDEMGKVVRSYGISTDIETLKQTEEKLREDERELSPDYRRHTADDSSSGPIRRATLRQPSDTRLYRP